MTVAARKPGLAERPSITADPAAPPPHDGPRLRLAATRGTLGLELDAPVLLGPLRLAALTLTFPSIRFPIDLSGGVTRFRHRRGALARLLVETQADELRAWVAPRLRGLLFNGTPEVWLAPIEGGWAVGLAGGEAALAFDVLVLPDGLGLALIPEHARGIGLSAAPHALALRAVAAATRGFGEARGGSILVPNAVALLLHEALPAAGARAPAAGGVAWEVPHPEEDRLRLEAQVDAPPPALPDRLVRAAETLLLTSEADLALYRNEMAAARDGYLTALERAPRHPEISERLAWLDAIAGERAEAALSTLIDVTPAAFAGLLGAELLRAVGDVDGARDALGRAAGTEPFAPLAARSWLQVAAIAADLRERLAALDEAVARAPSLADARWTRLSARLEAADPKGALADAQHLEAAARGVHARHEVLRRAARAFLAGGFSAEAHGLFERALRYVPDDAEAVAGLARALAAQGSSRRALDLYSRALKLAERKGTPTSGLAVDLAKALVEVAADRPAAIARARGVPASAPEAAEARLLEARWRAELGDLAGAGLALGRLRDHAERDPSAGSAVPGSEAATRAAAMAMLLVEAAAIDERFRDDLAGAQRDLSLALRLLPHDGRIQAAFRRVTRAKARHGSSPSASPTSAASPALPPPPRRATVVPRTAVAPPHPVLDPIQSEPPPAEEELADFELRAEPASDNSAEPRDDDSAEPASAQPSSETQRNEAEALAERLSERVRANPRDRAMVLSLCDVLERLGRDLELFALLSARMDEGDEDERAALSPRRRVVLARLASRARTAGNPAEAELYEMMLATSE